MPSSLSFHCMICFEEFSHELYPVVLPCGHTYICKICASKIDRCMECRETLFAPVPKALDRDNNTNHHNTHSRNSYHQYDRRRANGAYNNTVTMSAASSGHPNNTITKPEKKRFPLPKNVVLLSLIESTQVGGQSFSASTSNDGPRGFIKSDSSDSEEGKIMMSTDLATSSCGTYAVAKKGGLKIVPYMERKSINREESAGFVHGFSQNNGSIIKRMKNLKVRSHSTDKEVREEIPLNYGDRVQVVTIVNNWAKLARGYGYVYCENSSDLVKVAGVLDKSCAIESMLYMLSYKRKDLLEQKTATEKDAVSLMHELQETMIAEDDLTVIGAEAFSSDEIVAADDDDMRDDQLVVLDSRPNEVKQLANESEDCIVHRRGDDDTRRKSQSNTFSSWFSGFSTAMTSNQAESRTDATMNKTKISHAMRTSAESWREKNGKGHSVGDIDFRTGMSGHLGAMGHSAQKYNQVQYERPKMSCHSGLTPKRRRNSISKKILKPMGTDEYYIADE